jgi:hypothetical protein
MTYRSANRRELVAKISSRRQFGSQCQLTFQPQKQSELKEQDVLWSAKNAVQQLRVNEYYGQSIYYLYLMNGLRLHMDSARSDFPLAR